jgi:hypothetical protein
MRFVANPIQVTAFKITSVGPTAGGDSRTGIHLTLDDGRSVIAGPAGLATYTPVMGDYYIDEGNGIGFVPMHSAQFERKFRVAVASDERRTSQRITADSQRGAQPNRRVSQPPFVYPVAAKPVPPTPVPVAPVHPVPPVVNQGA